MRNLSTHEASTRATTRTRGRYTPAPSMGATYL